MSSEPVQVTNTAASARVRRFLWNGVLPEALGLCFVAIIFAGFAVAYVIADLSWRERSAVAARAEAETLVQSLATTLGLWAEKDADVPHALFQGVNALSRVRSVVWSTPDGSTRWRWPPDAGTPAGLTSTSLPAPGGKAGRTHDLIIVEAPVRGPEGAAAGMLRVETLAAVDIDYPTSLVWNWGLAAGVTLLVFVLLYRRLRRHLRPLGAIERGLQAYATGVEQDLALLTLSDAWGTVAAGWNRLIEQLIALQQQVQQPVSAGPPPDVLARFETALYRRVVDRLPFGVLCVGGQQCLSYANSAGAAFLGRPPEELAGVALGDVLDDAAVVEAVRNTQAGSVAGQVIDHVQPAGEVEVALRFRILPLAGRAPGSDVLVTIEDIAQLRETQRARDNFLYHVTHELRTPLTNIHAYVETLTRPGFDDEQTRKECYNVIISETRRLSSLVENILSISQLEVGTARLDIGEVDLQRLLRQMVQDQLGAADEKQIDLTLTLPPKVPKIRGDKQRLAVLLNNLLGNALKYTPARGKVHVRVEVQPRAVRIAVSDTGLGIGPEDQARVFEKFYRAADDAVQSVTGTGLGLAIAREVARLHGGEISLESERGRGSVFTVELPLSATDVTEGAPA